MTKVVFITGSSSGIGEHTAYRFAREGHILIITYHNDREAGKKVASKCLDLGASEVLSLNLDLVDDESIKETIRQIADKYGRIDILINNAGTLRHGYLKDKSFEDISLQLRSNLEGMIKITKECLPYLKGSIVNIGSSLALEGLGRFSIYTASKFGVRGFTQSLAKELPDLRVYLVNPGMTATKMVSFQGVHPAKVAEIIFNAATGRYRVKSGADINVREYLHGESWKPFFALKKIVGDIVKGRKR